MPNDSLKHYGVLGMKWGVRRYQDKKGRLTSAGKEHIKERRKNARVEKTIQDYIQSGKAAIKNLDNYQVGELSTMTMSNGEQFVSGLISSTDFDAVEKNSRGLTAVKQFRRWIDEGLTVDDIYGGNKKLDEKHAKGQLDLERDVKTCNPGFGEPGTTQNCAKASVALELNLRGINLKAGRQTYPSSVDAHSLWFKDAERVDYDSGSVEDALRSYGTKTSGSIAIRYKDGVAGHSMHWTNDIDGNFQIQDGQNGRVFNSVKEMMKEYNADETLPVTTFRLDNCEPNWDALEQDSVVRESRGYVGNKYSSKSYDTWGDYERAAFTPPPIPTNLKED